MEMHTVSAREGAATPAASKAQDAKLPLGFEAKQLYEILSIATVTEYYNVVMGEPSMVVETMRVQPEDVAHQLPRATVTELPPDNP